MQVKAPNRLTLLRPKAMVVSVTEKVRGTDQVWIKETNAREPLKTCRTLLDDVETEGWDVQSGYVWEATCVLPRWHPAWRRRELDLGSWVERGNLFSDGKGEAQRGGPHECQSAKAGNRGGAACSSEEGSVMERERRGCSIQLY
jgi:hypothetical protein